jgi:hypothetical protein
VVLLCIDPAPTVLGPQMIEGPHHGWAGGCVDDDVHDVQTEAKGVLQGGAQTPRRDLPEQGVEISRVLGKETLATPRIRLVTQ